MNSTAPKLRRRLMFFTICAVLISNCLVALIAISPLRRELFDRETAWLAAVLDAKVLAADQYMSKFSEITRQFTSRTMIRKKLESYNSGLLSLDELVDYTAPKLKEALDKAPEAAGVTRFDAQGKSVVVLGLPVDLDRIPKHVPKDGDVWVSSPYEVAGRSVLNIAASIYGDGRFVGLDVVIFKVHPVRAYFASWIPMIRSLKNSWSRKP